MTTPKKTLSLEFKDGYDSDGNIPCPGAPKKKRVYRHEHLQKKMKRLEEEFRRGIETVRPLNKNVLELLDYQRKLAEENERLKSTINYYEGMMVLMAFLAIFNYI